MVCPADSEEGYDGQGGNGMRDDDTAAEASPFIIFNDHFIESYNQSLPSGLRVRVITETEE